MATALSAQLAQIAANSKNTLDIKAQKAAHSKSLIFEPRVAAGQTYQAVYSICREGFDSLCELDARFISFGATLFSEQSQDEDRTQMTSAENTELDKKVDSFLRLVAARIRLMPAIKALEWLIRRFRIHEYNTTMLISIFLPYHTLPAFVTLLSILPSSRPPMWNFLEPYVRSLTPLPRALLVQQAIQRPDFLATLSSYTLDSCKAQQHYPALISFWGGIMTEAVHGMLDRMQSGRSSIQRSNDQNLLVQIGPILSDALVMDKVPELQIACYMVIAVFVSKGDLDDGAINAMMEQLVAGWTESTVRPGLVCLAMLSQYRSPKQMSKKVTKALLQIRELGEILADISKNHSIERLANGLCIALIERLCKKGDARGLPIVESILAKQVLNERQQTVAFKSLLLAAHRVDDSVDEDGNARKVLAGAIITLSQIPGEAGAVFLKAVEDTEVDLEALEMKLDMEIRPKTITNIANEDEPMPDVKAVEAPEDFDTALRRINNISTSSKVSCLASFPPDVFAELCSVFLVALSSTEKLAAFEKYSPIHADEDLSAPFYFSFFMRIWCGPYPILARVGALNTVRDRFKKGDCDKVDFQQIIPYCIVALSDPSRKVRRAAADLVIVLGSFYPRNDEGADKSIRWAKNELYTVNDSLEWISSDVCRRLLHGSLIPILEECVLNADHIHAAIQKILNGSPQESDGDEKDKKSHLSHSARLSLLKFFAGHTVQTSLLTTKLRLLTPMNQVKGVSGTTRTQLLLPLLRWWATLSAEDATGLCVRDGVSEEAFDESSVAVILPNDTSGLEFLLEIASKPVINQRKHLLHCIFVRLEKIWPTMKSQSRFIAAERLLELSQEGSESKPSEVSNEAAELLKVVELSGDILLVFLDSLQNTAAKMATEPPAKRRRTSSSEAHRAIGARVVLNLSTTLKRVTFVLQLVESSDPEKHPELLQPLFRTLSELQHLRVLAGSELGYLQNLVLRSLLAMMPAYKSDKNLRVDSSSGHGDLLVSCVQKSSSPAVQNTALLLVASLATVAPDLVLHSVMPIFTFMGTSVLRQSDDYSAHVINQTVKEVVPPLIESLRKGKKGPISGAAELLGSFATAFEHIPTHRRLGLFVSLTETLGPKDFLFALLSMLVDRYGSTEAVLSFESDVFNHFSAEIQLQSLVQLLDLISDLFKSKPELSSVLLGNNDEGSRDQQKIALRQLTLVVQLLSSRKLTVQIGKLTERDDMEAAKIRELYATLLENLLVLAETMKPHKTLHSRCGDALSKLLNLLSVGEFIKAVENLLDKQDHVLRRKVLRAVEVRAERENQGDANSRTILLAFLPQLTAIIRTTQDMPFKHIAVSCVDKIAEKYGKKDPEAVAAAAATIASEQCLGQADGRLRVMALLCLASLVDVLQEGIVPILPAAIPKALAYIKESFEGDEAVPELHNAAYAFITSLAQHLPYMLSGSYLEQLLAVSNKSAEAWTDSEPSDARLECLHFIAKQVEAKNMFNALEQNWSSASSSGFKALKEYLQVLGMTVDKHSKADVAKNVQALSKILFNAFDLRRLRQTFDLGGEASRSAIMKTEQAINDVALRMIYKLNDAAFRPVFSQLMDWAASSLPKSEARGKSLRLLSVFGFLFTFFDNLKSIVTSYASYITDSAVSVLNTADPTNQDDRDLWRMVLKTLGRCFANDQDDFWQAPAHFNAIAPVLSKQFAHAASVDLEADLIPTIVELAAAADSQEHQKDLNSALLKHLRSEQSQVRLAAVRCEQALTARLGEEWLAMLPEMLPYISELQDDDDEEVERETHKWIVGIEGVLGESLDAMLQ